MVVRDVLPLVAFVVSTYLAPAHVAAAPQRPGAGSLLPVVAKAVTDGAPAVQFVALARERGQRPQKDWSDMQVTIWDVPVAKPAVRRIALGRSHWNALPLLDSPTLLRWQVPASLNGRHRGYDVRLLRVDYERFVVAELLHAQQAHAISRAGNRVYLRTEGSQQLLDVSDGSLRELRQPINLLAQHGSEWLVEIGGQVALFDAAKGEVTRRFDAIQAKPAGSSHDYTRWEGGRFAVRDGEFVDKAGKLVGFLDFGVASVVYRELRIWDLHTGSESQVRVRTQARGGSGEPILPMEMRTELVGGLFRYTERRPAAGKHRDLDAFDWERDAEWVTIDIATGKELLRVPYRERDLRTVDPLQQHRVPDYLQEDFLASPIRGWGAEQDLAFAFLEHKGIDAKLPKSGVCKFDAVCRTERGEQLLVLLRDTLYLCDLGKRSVQKWPAPAAWGSAMVALHAVTMR